MIQRLFNKYVLRCGARTRSLTKSVTWRIVGMMNSFCITWFLTGSTSKAGAYVSISVFTATALYYLHERAWVWYFGKEPLL